MSFTISALNDLPGGQQVETHPSMSFARYQGTIAGGASDYIIQQGASSDHWLIGVRSIISWWFRSYNLTASPGVTLNVYLCSDPSLAAFDFYNCYTIPRDVGSGMTGLVLMGMAARFRLVNAHLTDSTDVIGHIKIQGGF